LAKFRALIYQGKYGAVIGLIKPSACELLLGTYKKTSFTTNHSAVFDPVNQTTDFRRTTVLNTVWQWLTPSQLSATFNSTPKKK